MVYDLAGNYILGFLFRHCLGQIYGRKMLHLKARVKISYRLGRWRKEIQVERGEKETSSFYT